MKCFFFSATTLSFLFSFMANDLFAKTPLPDGNLASAQANLLVITAVNSCATKGYLVTATAVDSSGNVLAMLRKDEAGPHTIDASKRKAYTAASAKNKTSAMLLASQSNPLAQNLGEIDGFLLLGGGVPIYSQSNKVIGALGVGGAPNGNLDEECAQAAIDKL